MTVETIAEENIPALVLLMLELWPDSLAAEEMDNCKAIAENKRETCYLIKEQEEYIAFIHIATRFDYVEGADALPVAYIEGMYVKALYRHLGVGRMLIQLAEEWSRLQGFTQLASDSELENTGSIAFHQKSGFQETNRMVCFIKEL